MWASFIDTHHSVRGQQGRYHLPCYRHKEKAAQDTKSLSKGKLLMNDWDKANPQSLDQRGEESSYAG